MPALGLLGADDPLHKPLDLADPLATVQRVVLGFPTAADTGPKLRPASPTGEAIPQPPSATVVPSIHMGPVPAVILAVGSRSRPREDSSASKSRVEPELRGGKAGLGGRRRSAAPSAEERRFAVRGR